ncbi:MAG: hypothetical protein MZV63_10615 [Marinilabiliales bacterium]|nr:hypothetical protein [Marinilabiliales bacterium]
MAQASLTDFCRQIKDYDPNLPIIIQSCNPENEKLAEEYGDGISEQQLQVSSAGA